MKRNASAKTQRESSGGTRPAHTPILDFQPSALLENGCLLFKPPCLWHFVIAALANQYRPGCLSQGHWEINYDASIPRERVLPQDIPMQVQDFGGLLGAGCS